MLLPGMLLEIDDPSTVLPADKYAVILQKAEDVIAVIN